MISKRKMELFMLIRFSCVLCKYSLQQDYMLYNFNINFYGIINKMTIYLLHTSFLTRLRP